MICSLLKEDKGCLTFSHPDLVAFWVYFKALVNQAQGPCLETQVSDPWDGALCKKPQDLATPQEMFNNLMPLRGLILLRLIFFFLLC